MISIVLKLIISVALTIAAVFTVFLFSYWIILLFSFLFGVVGFQSISKRLKSLGDGFSTRVKKSFKSIIK